MTITINDHYWDSLHIAFCHHVATVKGNSECFFPAQKWMFLWKFQQNQQKHFSGNRRTGIVFSLNSDQLHEKEREMSKKRDWKIAVSSLGRCENDFWFGCVIVWRLAYLWITCDLYFIQRWLDSRLLCYLHVAEVPLSHAQKEGRLQRESETQPVTGTRENNSTGSCRYLIRP